MLGYLMSPHVGGGGEGVVALVTRIPDLQVDGLGVHCQVVGLSSFVVTSFVPAPVLHSFVHRQSVLQHHLSGHKGFVAFRTCGILGHWNLLVFFIMHRL